MNMHRNKSRFFRFIARFLVAAGLATFADAMPLFAAIDDEAKLVSENGDVRVVEACGRGLSEKSAIKDAVRNAVVFVVGQLVDAQTITQNEDAIEDRIVSVSNGFAESVQPIEGPENRGGTVLVRVRANVKSGQMKTDIAKFSEMSMDFNPSAAKAALEAKIENVEDVGKFLVNAWDTYVKLFKLEQVGEPTPVMDEPKLKFKLKFSLDSRAFRNVFRKSLRKAFKAMKITPTDRYSGSSYLCLDIPGAQHLEYYLLGSFFPKENMEENRKLWRKYVLDVIKKHQYSYVIECLDEDGEIIASTKKKISYDGNEPYVYFDHAGKVCEVGHEYSWRISFYPKRDNKFFTSVEFDEEVTFPTAEDIKDVKTIKIYVKKEIMEN